MLSSYYNKTGTVTRLATTTGNKKAYGTHIEDLPCYFQPEDRNLSEGREGSFGKNSLLFCDTADIKEGDHITIDSKEYRVAGVQSYETGSHKHMEVLIRIF